MKKRNYLSLDSSILYRCSQKYFDKQFEKMGLGYAQINFLTMIYENEGISMVDLANNGSFDKGTITKSLSKLQENDFVRIESDETDKRRKLLYTTEKTQSIIPKIYLLKQSWWDYLSMDLNDEEFDEYIRLTSIIQNRAREYNNFDNDTNMPKFFGMQKLSLVDYPGKMATTLFTGGCNLRCPFCHNRDLVFINENQNEIKTSYVFEYLNKRMNIIDGVCISGGEPLIHENIAEFINIVKQMGYKVKIDTNGLYPSRLKKLIDMNLVDYVAVDIKNTLDKYNMTTGTDDVDTDNILKTIEILKNSYIDYEFRTTVVKEFHSEEDILKIAKMIAGAKKYYLQMYVDKETVISPGFHHYSKNEMEHLKDIASQYVKTELRGVE